MAAEIGNAAAGQARGVPVEDLLGSELDREIACPSTQRKCAPNKVLRQLEILTLRSLELADRVAAGELAFIEAVDLAYAGAVWAGLPNALERSGLIDIKKVRGDDVVQATLAAAFANARRLPT